MSSRNKFLSFLLLSAKNLSFLYSPALPIPCLSSTNAIPTNVFPSEFCHQKTYQSPLIRFLPAHLLQLDFLHLSTFLIPSQFLSADFDLDTPSATHSVSSSYTLHYSTMCHGNPLQPLHSLQPLQPIQFLPLTPFTIQPFAMVIPLNPFNPFSFAGGPRIVRFLSENLTIRGFFFA